MKLGIASDLHLEFSTTRFEMDEVPDILLLAGDIFVADCLVFKESGYRKEKREEFLEFLHYVSKTFPQTYLIAGNHEFYGSEYSKALSLIQSTIDQEKINNIRFLDKKYVELSSELLLFGGTLWTNFNDNPSDKMYARGIMNDFRVIKRHYNNEFRKFIPDDACLEFYDTIRELDKCLSSDKKIIVMTHHAPCGLSVADEYKGARLNCAYYSDLSQKILDNPQIKIWVHGHLHNESDYYLGSTRIICNPRDYHTDASPTKLKVIEID